MIKFLKHLMLVISILYFFQIAEGKEAHLNFLDSLDISGFNEEQQQIIKEESAAYAKTISPLFVTDNQAWKQKIMEFFANLRDGFKVYNITSRNQALEDSLDAFFGETGIKVYVISYVDGAFLNNIFQRLAELKYQTKSNHAIEIKFKFKKNSQEIESDLFNYYANVIISDAVKDTLREALKAKIKKSEEIENAIKNLSASLSTQNVAIFKTTSAIEVSMKVDEVLGRFKGLGLKSINQTQLSGALPFVVFDPVSSNIDKQIEIKLAEILKDAKSMYLRQQAAKFTRVGSTVIMTVAFTLFPHESPQERIYDVAMEANSAISSWYNAYGIKQFSEFIWDCSANDIVFDYVNQWRLMSIQKDYLIYEIAKEHYTTTIDGKTFIGSEIVEIIPSSFSKHSVIQKAVSKGFKLNSFTNLMPVPRLFTIGQTPSRINNTFYVNSLKSYLDKLPSNISEGDAFNIVQKLICEVQSSESYTEERDTWGPEYSSYKIRNPFENPKPIFLSLNDFYDSYLYSEEEVGKVFPLLFEKQDFEKLKEYIDEFNLKNRDNRLVFRYLSIAEYNNKFKSLDDTEYILALNRKYQTTLKYITPDFYTSSKVTKSRLALPVEPDIGVWTFEKKILVTKTPAGPGIYNIVAKAYEEPGGGKEATINQPFPILGFFPLIK